MWRVRYDNRTILSYPNYEYRDSKLVALLRKRSVLIPRWWQIWKSKVVARTTKWVCAAGRRRSSRFTRNFFTSQKLSSKAYLMMGWKDWNWMCFGKPCIKLTMIITVQVTNLSKTHNFLTALSSAIIAHPYTWLKQTPMKIFNKTELTIALSAHNLNWQQSKDNR